MKYLIGKLVLIGAILILCATAQPSYNDTPILSNNTSEILTSHIDWMPYYVSIITCPNTGMIEERRSLRDLQE